MINSPLRWIIRLVLIVMIGATVTFFYLAHQRRQPQYLAARAQEAIQAGNDDKAEIYLRNLLQRAPDDADVKLALADLFVRKAKRDGQPESYAADGRALQLLVEAAALRPEDPDLQTKLMIAYVEGGRGDAATGVAEKLVRTGSKDQTALQLVASKAVGLGNYAQAEELLARLAAVQPDPPWAVLLLQAQLYSRQGAKDRLAEVVEKAGKKPAAEVGRLAPQGRQMLRTILALGVQGARNAEEAYRRAGQTLTALEEMGRSEDAQGKAALVREAAAVVVLVGQAHPLKPPAPPALLKEWQKLITQFAALARPLVGKGDIGPLGYYLSAEAEIAEGNQAATLALLDQGIAHGEKLPAERAGELAPLHLLAAQLLAAHRRLTEAQPHWKWLLEHEATAAWGHRFAGRAALGEGRLDEAAGHFEAALPQFDEVELHAALAAIDLRLGRWKQAAEQLKTVLARQNKFSDADRAAVQRHLGAIEQLPLLLGKADVELKHYGEVPPLIEMLKAGKQEPAAIELSAAYHQRREEQREAVAELSAGRAKYPADFGLLLAEIGMLQAQSQDDEAIARLQKFTEENPKHVDALLMLAQWRVQRGETAAALALADDVAKRFPDSAGAKLLRVDIRLAAGKLDEALPMLDELRRSGAHPEAVALLQARAALMGHHLKEAADALRQTGAFRHSAAGKLWQGELSSAQGDFESAAAEFSDSFQVSSLRPAARQGLVQALAALSLQEDPATVEAKVNRLLAEFPKEPLLLAISAELAARQGRFDRALTMLDRAEVLQPDSLLIVRAKAATRLQMGQVEQALAEAKRASQIDPRDVPSRLLAAQADLARNEPKAALTSVEQALASQPKSVDARLLRAEILRRLGRGEQAVTELQDLIAQVPDAFAAYTLAAEIHEEQHRGEKALEVLRAAEKQFPTLPLLGFKHIALLCRLKRADEAEKLADQLAGPKPKAEMCLALGATFLEEKELTTARRWAERGMALADKPQQTAAKLLLANITLVQGRRAKDKTLLAQSRDFYRQVFDAQPENLLAANNLAWLLAVEFAQPEKAREVVDQTLAKTSAKRLPASVADTFAMVYRETGQLDAGQQIVDEALRRNPELAMLNFEAGLIYGLKHHDDAAQAALRKALKLGLPEEDAAKAEAELQRLETAADQRRQQAEAERRRRDAARQAQKAKSTGKRAEKETTPKGG